MGGFQEKVVLITGASSGIGAETAIQFAADGASVALVGRNEERLEKTAQSCRDKGLSKEKVLTIQADMCNEEDVKRIVESTINHFGKLHVLVNNAGGGYPTNIQTETLMADYDTMMRLNVRTIVQISNLAVPHLIASKGCIVNVSSICGKRVMPTMLVYNIAKCALDQLTRVSSLELAPKGVRVNAVNPGTVMTPAQAAYGMSDEQLRERARRVHPLGRPAETNDIASAVKFLASDAASFITGETLSIDGGRHVLCPR